MTSPAEQAWPTRLWLVRHGESAGNVARAHAEAQGLPVIDLAHRDVDVPLSPLGERQACALGAWFAGQAEDERPGVVLSSPYVRAIQTADRIIEGGRMACASLVHVHDERLREKEYGSIDRLTRAGIIARFPDEARRYDDLGKFYYRPPGGESWCDVILRLRSLLDHVQLQYQRARVLIVAHQVTVLCIRYLLENMSEAQILAMLLGASDQSGSGAPGTGQASAQALVGGVAADIAAQQFNTALASALSGSVLQGISAQLSTTEGGLLRTGVAYSLSDKLRAVATYEGGSAASSTTTTTAGGTANNRGARTQISLDWRFLPNWLVRSTFSFGDQTSSGIDMLWQYRY